MRGSTKPASSSARSDSCESLKRKNGGPGGRQLDIHAAVLLNGLEHHPESHGLVRRRPNGKRDSAARAQHPKRFGERGFGTSEMQHSEADTDRVKTHTRKRQIFGTAGTE